jgi:RNA binding exosome subunit
MQEKSSYLDHSFQKIEENSEPKIRLYLQFNKQEMDL